MPPVEAMPRVTVMMMSGAALMRASAFVGDIPLKPTSAATSTMDRDWMRESAPEPSPNQ